MTTEVLRERSSVSSVRRKGLQTDASPEGDPWKGFYHAGAAVLLLFLLRFVPASGYWRIALELLRLDLWWPGAVTAAALVFTGLSFRYQRLHGRALCSPSLALAIGLLFAAAVVPMTFSWSVDWRLGHALAATVAALLALSVLVVLVALMAYSELWRWTCNRAVVSVARRALTRGRFRDYLRGHGKWLGLAVPRPRWASRHALRIVLSRYEDLRAALMSLLASEPPTGILNQFVDAGSDLIEYLEQRWAGDIPDAETRRWMQIETLREMLTLVLWFEGRARAGRSAGAPALVSRDDVRRWIGQLRRDLGPEHDAYGAFLECLAELDEPVSQPRSGSAHRDLVRRVTDLYGNVPRFRAPDPETPEAKLPEDLSARCFVLPPHLDFRAVCAHSWLALSAGRLPDRIVHDVWMELRADDGLFPDVGDDAARVCARAVLPEIYGRWRDATPPGWQSGLSGREDFGRARRALPKPPGAFSAGLLGDTRKTSSWPYFLVWQTPAVRRLVLWPALTCGLLAWILIGLVNPRLRLPREPHWNTVDHVADRRFGNDYTRATFTAMAGSRHWLALGTADRGLTLLDKATRVPHRGPVDGPVLDVALGARPDSFLALTGDQGISRIARKGRDFAAATWLPAPSNPWWRGNGSAQLDQVVASAYDEEGWLLAIRQRGVARYVFSKDDRGRLYRARSWQTASLSDAALEEARFTRRGIWLSLREGGIRYADRHTLAEVDSRRIGTPPLAWLESSYEGDWASAADARARLWLYSAHPAGGGLWLGPVFGTEDACQPLASPQDVVNGLLLDDFAWLGTAYGLYVHDPIARRIRCLLPGQKVVAMDVVETSPRQLLVATGGGLYLVARPDAAGDVRITPLDQLAIREMSVSPDGKLCAYRGDIERQDAAPLTVVRALAEPFAGARPLTVLADQGWKALASAPEVTGVVSTGETLLFATSRGAFAYDTRRHSYEDASVSLFVRHEQEQPTREEVRLDAFTALSGGSHLLAIADGNPQLASGGTGWRSLDPYRRTRPRQLLSAGSEIYGLGPDGEIYRYAWLRRPDVLFAGRISNLPEPPEDGFLGDLTGTGDSWEAAWVHQGQVLRYDSDTGALDRGFLSAPGSRLTQIRLLDQGLLELYDDGMLKTPELARGFGRGGLPFPPSQAASLAPSLTPNDVLVGGPGGEVLRYDWQSGSWSQEAAAALPGRGPVRQIRETAWGILARSSEKVFLSQNGSWASLPGYGRWAVDGERNQLWLAGDQGVSRFTPQAFKPWGQWPAEHFSQGSGMRAFVETARFAWQLDPQRVAFLSSSGELGLYDAGRETWSRAGHVEWHEPRQLAATPDRLAVLDGLGVVEVDPSFAVRRLRTLPSGVDEAALRRQDGRLQLAFIERGGAVLTPDLNGGRTYRHGGSPAPEGFDPAAVVFAEALAPDGVVLLTDAGACAVYEHRAGRWRSVRSAIPGQQVYGWQTPRDEDDSSETVFFLTAESGRGVKLFLEAGAVTAEEDWDQDVSRLSEAEAEQPAAAPAPQPAGAPTAAEPRPLVRPGDGPVLETETLKLHRQAQRTSYRQAAAGVWRALHPSPTGFAEDTVTDVAFSPSGQLWGLQDGRLVRLDPVEGTSDLAASAPPPDLPRAAAIETLPNGALRLVTQAGGELWLTDSAGPPEAEPRPENGLRLARLDFAGRQLEWRWRPGETIRATWSAPADSALPVWSADGRRLALQAVSDLALTEKGLLTATEAGLVLRHAETFAMLEWRPELSQLPETEAGGGSTPQAESGPWRWSLLRTPGSRGLLIEHSGDQRPRRLDGPAGGPWRFADDRAHWVGRDASRQLWLATGDGLWPFDVRGRRADLGERLGGKSIRRVAFSAAKASWWWQDGGGQWHHEPASEPADTGSASAEAPEWEIRNPAIHAVSRLGRIRFTSSDGGPVFAGGSLFFDHASHLAGDADRLYVLVPGRGVLARDAGHPGVVRGFWPLSAQLPADAEIRHTSRGLELRSRAGGRGWWLDPGAPGASWQEGTLGAFQVPGIRSGPFVWRPEREGARTWRVDWQPREESSPRRMTPWWDRDRFSWDRVRNVGALNARRIVLLTAAGPMVYERDGSGAFDPQYWWRTADVQRVAVARSDEAPLGLLLSGGSERYLLTDGDEPELGPWPAGRPAIHQATLTFGREPGEGSIGFRQEWTAGGSVVRVDVGLPGFPLLQGGQLTLDRAAGACAVDGSEGTWFVWTDAARSAPGYIVKYQVREAADGPRLVAREIWPSLVGLRALRAVAPDRLLALARAGADWSWHKGALRQGELSWEAADRAETGNSFRVGDRVVLETAALRFGSRPRFAWDEEPAAEVVPAGYGLFLNQGGNLALAFDVLTSLALDRDGSRIALGTHGGILFGPYREGDQSLMLVESPNAALRFAASQTTLDASAVDRIRRDERGNLWIRRQGDSTPMSWTPEGEEAESRQVLPFNKIEVGACEVSVGAAALEIGGTQYFRSNDAMGLGQRPFSEIIDLDVDRMDQTLWLCDRENGVFKVLLACRGQSPPAVGTVSSASDEASRATASSGGRSSYAAARRTAPSWSSKAPSRARS